MIFILPYLILAAVPTIQAAPAPAARLDAPQPLSTPKATLVDQAPTPVDKRGIDDTISSELGSLGSDVPSYVASGVPNFFQGFPTGSAVQSSLGLHDSDLAALPTNVLNLP